MLNTGIDFSDGLTVCGRAIAFSKMPMIREDPVMITAEEASKTFGYHSRWLRKLILAGKLRGNFDEHPKQIFFDSLSSYWVKNKARRRGVSPRCGRPWTLEEDQVVSSPIKLQRIADILGRTWCAVKTRRHNLKAGRAK